MFDGVGLCSDLLAHEIARVAILCCFEGETRCRGSVSG
jgi:hypothetical protein